MFPVSQRNGLFVENYRWIAVFTAFELPLEMLSRWIRLYLMRASRETKHTTNKGKKFTTMKFETPLLNLKSELRDNIKVWSIAANIHMASPITFKCRLLACLRATQQRWSANVEVQTSFDKKRDGEHLVKKNFLNYLQTNAEGLLFNVYATHASNDSLTYLQPRSTFCTLNKKSMLIKTWG